MSVTSITTSLTGSEAAAVRTYLDATAGMPDTFDQLDAATLHDVEEDRGDADAVTEYVAELFSVLRDWHDALDQLHAELALATPSQSSLHPAAEAYVRAEADAFVRRLNVTRKAYCDWLFAENAGPVFQVDGGHLVFSNFPPVMLTGEIAAEAAQ